MNTDNLLSLIDVEIANLQKAKEVLLGVSKRQPAGPRRPKAGVAVSKRKRNLTPEGRARIAEAVKQRWARQKAKQKSKP